MRTHVARFGRAADQARVGIDAQEVRPATQAIRQHVAVRVGRRGGVAIHAISGCVRYGPRIEFGRPIADGQQRHGKLDPGVLRIGKPHGHGQAGLGRQQHAGRTDRRGIDRRGIDRRGIERGRIERHVRTPWGDLPVRGLGLGFRRSGRILRVGFVVAAGFLFRGQIGDVRLLFGRQIGIAGRRRGECFFRCRALRGGQRDAQRPELLEHGQHVGAERCGARVGQLQGGVQRLRLAIEKRVVERQLAGGRRVVGLVKGERAAGWFHADHGPFDRRRLAPGITRRDGQRHRARCDGQQGEKVARGVQPIDRPTVDRHGHDRHVGRDGQGAAGQRGVRTGPQTAVRRGLRDNHRGHSGSPADRGRIGPRASRRRDRILAGQRAGQREHGAALTVGPGRTAGGVRADDGEVHANARQRLRPAAGQCGDEQLLLAHKLAGRRRREFQIGDRFQPPERLTAQIAVGIGVAKAVDEHAEGEGSRRAEVGGRNGGDRFQLVGAGRDGQLGGEVAAGADPRKLVGGDHGAVQLDRADGGGRGDDVKIIDVKPAQRDGQRIAVQKLFDRRHQQQRRVAQRVVPGIAVGELGYQDRAAGGELGRVLEQRLVELAPVERRDQRPVHADFGPVPRGQQAEAVAAAPRGQWHGHEVPPPRGDRRQLLDQIVRCAVVGRHPRRAVPAPDADRLVRQDHGACQVGDGRRGQLVDLPGVQLDRIRLARRPRANRHRQRHGYRRTVCRSHQPERRRAAGQRVAFAVRDHQVLAAERVAGQGQKRVGTVRQVAQPVHGDFVQRPHAHAARFHLVAARDLGRGRQRDPRDLARADHERRQPRSRAGQPRAGQHHGARRIDLAGDLQHQFRVLGAQRIAGMAGKGQPEIRALTVRQAPRRRGHLLDLKAECAEPLADHARGGLVAGRDQRVRPRLGQGGRQLVGGLPLEDERARRPLQVEIHLLRIVDHVEKELLARRGVEVVTHAVHGRGRLAVDGRVPRNPLLAIRRHVPQLKGIAARLVAAAVDLQRVRAGLGQGQGAAIQAVVGKVAPRVHQLAARVAQPGLQNRAAAGSLEIHIDRLARGGIEPPLLGRAGRGDAARVHRARARRTELRVENGCRGHLPQLEAIRPRPGAQRRNPQRVRPGGQAQGPAVQAVGRDGTGRVDRAAVGSQQLRFQAAAGQQLEVDEHRLTARGDVEQERVFFAALSAFGNPVRDRVAEPDRRDRIGEPFGRAVVRRQSVHRGRRLVARPPRGGLRIAVDDPIVAVRDQQIAAGRLQRDPARMAVVSVQGPRAHQLTVQRVHEHAAVAAAAIGDP